MTDETYLGSGIWASFDGSRLKLRAPQDGREDYVIFLDLNAARELVAYIEQLRRQTGEFDDCESPD